MHFKKISNMQVENNTSNDFLYLKKNSFWKRFIVHFVEINNLWQKFPNFLNTFFYFIKFLYLSIGRSCLQVFPSSNRVKPSRHLQ